jgi:uncharacterized protein (DUF608 family)
VEIWPDGYFHEWQIFNLGRWAPQQPECCRVEGPDMPPGALAFFVWAKKEEDAPIVRRLGMRSDQHNLYSFAWLKSVQEIEFEGKYPLATLAYRDADLPVAVTARMFSPFLPHDSRTSGTPGFYAAFTLKNLAEEPVQVSLLGTLKNPLAWGAADRQLRNAALKADDAAYLTMRTDAKLGCAATLGSIGLAVRGGEPSWIAGDFSDYFRDFHNWDATFGIVDESVLHEFRAAGKLPSLDGGQSPVQTLRMTNEEIDALPMARKRQLLDDLARYPVFQSFRDRVESVDKTALASDAGMATFLKAIRDRLDRLAGKDRRAQKWGDGALCSSLSLAPGEEKEIVFTLAWFLPNHYSAKGPYLGHMYENWFKDAEEVNRFLMANAEPHRKKVAAFAEALFDSTLEPEFADSWAGQLTTLPKCTWWTKRGDFGVWEGLGCCGFHTTDITYQGSFNLLALFPDLQKRQMEMGAKHQRADGRVHHFFTPDFSQVDNGFDRVDMNQQFVLLAARDYLWTGDEDYLRRLWPHIVRAMDNTAQLDANGDGLPDHDTRRNTYDAWNFFGTPSYIASLWLSALLAAIRLAEGLGEKKAAANWKKLLKKGIASFDEKLWNGEYYSLWVDGEERDECCMTDQIDGEWFTQLIGLGTCLPRERIVDALKAILRYNFNPEDGLINASYPPKRKPRLSTYRNLQAMAPWTGIEHAIASMMLDFGLVEEGRAVVRNIHERYLRAARFWNHVECGDHYYRAMSSWAILLGATGFKIDVPGESVSFAPVVGGDFRAPWVSSSGWGRFTQSEARFELGCESGVLSFRELRLKLDGAKKPSACLNGKKLTATAAKKGGVLTLSFSKPVAMREGDSLVVE